MRKLTLLLVAIAITTSSFAQIGINTTTPDSSAILDLNSTNKGLLIPTMTTTERETMQANPPATGLADGLLVYDTDYKRFYFWDASVNKWVVMNNWRKEYTTSVADDEHVSIVLENNSNVGINQTSPTSKLTVNGNISVGNTNTGAPTNGAYIDGQVKIGYSGTNTDKLIVEGNTTTTGTANADEFVGRGITPVGGIIMYSGATDATLFDGTGLGVTGSKMEGWAMCNGSNGTPNLQDRFIVGAGNSYSLGNTGGENTHTITEAEMPIHNHTGTANTAGNHKHDMGSRGMDTGGTTNTDGSADDTSGGDTHYAGSHTHSLTINNTGGDQAHENRPPYYAVYYIMRIN